MNSENKNYRPYAVSVDWLQVTVHVCPPCELDSPERLSENGVPLPPQFQPFGGYTAVKKCYSTAVFKSVYDLFDDTGTQVATLACYPHSSALDPRLGLLKIENWVLYESDFLEVTLRVMSAFGLYYKGISRLDLAYDSNELYGGLKHSTLIANYRKNRVLKVGASEYTMCCKADYSVKRSSKESGSIVFSGEYKEHAINSVTWGAPTSAVKVQMYNKSKELREVKMKHYIVDYWKRCGLDTDRDVYRIEIRLTEAKKQLKNIKTGEVFALHVNDLVAQESIEQLFQIFAYKHFAFYLNDGKTDRKRRLKEYPIFCFNQTPVVRSCTRNYKKDYTRMHKILINNIEQQIAECKKLDVSIVPELETVRQYYIDAYGMENYIKERDAKITPPLKSEERANVMYDEQTSSDYYAKFSNIVAQRAAELRRDIERKFRREHEIESEEYREYLRKKNRGKYSEAY